MIKICLTALILIIFFSFETNAQNITIDDVKFSFKNTETFEADELSSAAGVAEDDIYDLEKISLGISSLKRFYFDNGFFSAEIDTILTLNKEDEEAIVEFVISENFRTRIDSLHYTGLDNISADARKSLRYAKNTGPKQFYSKSDLIKQTNDILDRLQNNGYMFARLKQDSGTIIRKNADSTVSVFLSFEGADTLHYFGKTKLIIEDNRYGVDKELLRKELLFKEGDVYSKQKKLGSEQAIGKFAIIQSVRLNADTMAGTTVPFTAVIKLNDKHEILPYARATEIENHLYVGGGFEYVNKYLWGGGRVLNVNLDALINSKDLNRFEISATLTQPQFLFKSASLSNKLTLGSYNLEGFHNYYAGLLSTVNYFISEHTFYNNAYVDLNAELVQFQYDDTSSVLNLFHSMLTLTAAHNSTNNVLSPTKGFYHSISAGSAGIIPELVIDALPNFNYSKFVKLYTANRFFLSFSRISVFATGFKIGDIIEYGNGEKQVPVQSIYKFFSGGNGSLRGWNAKQNGILDDKEDGGNFIFEGSFELRQRLFQKKENFMKNIGGALFIDYGNVWENAVNFRFDQIALATGFGLRYYFSFGPIRLDFGFRLYDPGNPNSKWLFSGGSNIFKDKFAVQFGIGEAF